MQKPLRPGIAPSVSHPMEKRIFFEALNQNFGYYYTINKTLCKTDTEFQKIELCDTDEFGKVLLLDNITQIGERSEYSYHEPMVHPAMCCHPRPESVLVIGGGDGGILREVLKYSSVKRVELAELDYEVIRFSRKHLASVHHHAFDDQRVHLNIIDGRHYTEEHPGEFDVVIMDMTDPTGPSRRLYTKEFFGTVAKSFKNPHGIFVMHSESPISRPAGFSCINKTLRSTFSHVNLLYTYIQMYGILWSFSISSFTISTASVTRRFIDDKLKKYNINELKVYNGATHIAMQTPYPYINSLLKKPARTITDKHLDFPDDFISQPNGNT